MSKTVSTNGTTPRKYKLKKASDLNKGPAGNDGRNGIDGKVGPQGPAGPASRDGRDGRDGAGFVWRGNFKPDTLYSPNDVVHYGGSSYICIKSNKGKPPSGTREYWGLVAEAGSHGGGGGGTSGGASATSSLTGAQAEVLSHWTYDESTRRLVSDKAIETTLNSMYLGDQHKMSSGSENIFFTNLSSDINFFPMWGGLKDQSLTVNQGASGFIPPSGRVFSDMFSLPLGGQPDPLTSVGYAGDNYFGVNISGLGITTVAAEQVDADVRLEYRITINGRQVYMQELPRAAARSSAGTVIYPNDVIEWFFDHPVDVRAGTTLHAEIHKVRNSDDVDLGIFQVRQGDTIDPNTGLLRYQATVHNRLFEDKDLELISPYLKYKAMDFSVDPTGTSILLKDLSLAAGSQMLIPHNINTIQAIANGTEIKIMVKDGAKVLIESLPVNAVSINGSFVNSVLNTAVTELNNLFTNTLSFASQGNPVTGFTLSGNDLTLALADATSYTVDVTTLGVDTNKFVASGALSGNIITLTMDDATSVFVDVAGLAVDNDTTIVSGSVAGNTMSLTTNSGSIIAVDVTSLATGSSTQVVSGSVVGTNLVLTMGDASTVTIDAANMINGSTLTATNDSWYISYGTDANQPVNTATTDATVRNKGPYYFGQKLQRGQEFKWNASVTQQMRFGIWDGAEEETAYNAGQTVLENWSTCFNFLNGGTRFINGTNTALITGTQYVVSANDPLSIRFGNDGHLTLIDLSGGTETEIAKTTIPLAVNEFNLQMGAWSPAVFPNGIIDSADFIWEIVHDYANTEAGIINGILDHTVLKSAISILPGEKIMFMLDEVGQGDFFGTDYTAAATGVSTAEEQLDGTFKYQTNEAIVFDTAAGVSDWNANTNAPDYFYAANLNQYRDGGSGTIQGMFSLRYTTDNSITLYDEDSNVKIATRKADGDGVTPLHLFFGVRGNRAYYSIPVISKQSITGGSQPNLTFAPDVSNQAFTVEQNTAFNLQIALDANSDIVNMYGESDAPSWAVLGQVTGQFIGTAPAHNGSSDSYVINCKAGNAIGGITNFTVTINVTLPAYTNTKSLSLDGSTNWLQGNPVNMTALERATNGDGSAWTISMWVKPTSSTATQTLMVYGAGDDYNGGAITLKQQGGSSLILNYGTVYNNIILVCGNAFTANTWQHVMVTFDGGTTGSVPADASDYYSRFDIYVDGVLQSPIGVASGGGYDGVLSGANPSDNIYRIGRASNVHNNYSGATINQVGIWGSDQSANIATIYNSGTAQDLSLLASAPAHYYEIETSVTTITDLIGSADLTGYNFTSADLVTDIP